MESTDNKRVRFAELLELHISNVIKKDFLNRALTPTLMREIRETVRTQIDKVFIPSKHNISPHARLWLADQFFKSIKFNGSESMDEQVIIHEYKLSELPYSDVQLLRNLFNETSLAEVLEEEYVRRSAS